MSFLEKDFQSLFTSWVKSEIKNGRHNISSVFELKLKKKGQRLSFRSDFQPHQLPALEKTQRECIFHKISDQSFGYKPFDCFVACGNAFVVVLWYEPRKPKQFVMIPIQKLLDYMNTGAKSITEDEAKKLGFIYQL